MEETRLASGLQSSGGKVTRQKLADGFEKATPISGISADPVLTSVTLQAISSLVAMRFGVHKVEEKLIHISHAEVGAYLLGLLGLPYAIVEAVAHRIPGPAGLFCSR